MLIVAGTSLTWTSRRAMSSVAERGASMLCSSLSAAASAPRSGRSRKTVVM